MSKSKYKLCANCNEMTPRTKTFARDENGYRTGAPVYACNLCDHDTPRRVYSTKRRRELALAFFSKTLNLGA